MWSLADESLLAGLGCGDPEAAAAFVRRFQSRVYGVAFAIVGEPAAAEDVAQETFLRAWRHAGAYDPRRGSVAAWLLTVARNLAIDAMRARGARPIEPHVLAAQLSASGAADAAADEGLGGAHEGRRVRQALMGLPEEQRRAVVLAAWFGRTAREISELDDIPLGTAKTRIRDAMIKLRARLEVGDEL
jgi:RNA polymerase sigma factor (sigma-70 family)